MLGELNQTEINSVLTSQVLGRLACTDGKQPYVVPVTYVYDGEYIYGQTNFGRKVKILRKNPKVCFEVDRMTDMRNWQSVVVYGKFEELDGEKAEKAREVLFGKIFQLMTSDTVHPHEHGTSGRISNTTRVKYLMYRIKIRKVTGRFEKQ